MVYKLKGRNVLVTGGSRGLGELICLKFAEEGCNVAINYMSSKDRAQALATKIEKEHSVKAILIQGDMGKEADCTRTVEEAIAQLGGLDILISNAGHTRFIPFADLHGPTSEDWDTCFAVNVKAQPLLFRAALSTFNANPEGGVFILTSSIAGIGPAGSSMPYSVTKAAQLHCMKCLAVTQGAKVRTNAILPGLLLTEWGLRYGDSIKALEERAILKKTTDLEDCAQAYVDTARNTSLTGQQIVIDSGLSYGSRYGS